MKKNVQTNKTAIRKAAEMAIRRCRAMLKVLDRQLRQDEEN